MLPNEQLNACLTIRSLINSLMHGWGELNQKRFKEEWNAEAAKLEGMVPQFVEASSERKRKKAVRRKTTKKYRPPKLVY